jgi:hypothetical protein
MRGAKLTAVVAVALLALYILQTFLARGVYNDDDLGHYLLARDAWTKPELFLNVWGRPLFTLVYAVPARLGFQAVQLTTAIVTALTAVITGAGAARLGAPAPLGAALYGTMPFVLLLAYSSLTEPICALVLAGALWAWLAGRRGIGLALAALVPLGRLELLPLVVLWGVLHAGLRPRRWLLGLVPAAGVLAWGIIAAAVSGDPLWIVHQIFTGQDRFYAPAGLWHYPRGLIYVVGPVVFLFALTDGVERAARRRFDLVSWGQLAVVALYAVFSWKLAVGQAAGFLRHLVAVAPLFALSASRGIATAFGGDRAAWRRAAGTLVAGSVIVGVFLSRALVMHHRAVGPFEPVRLVAAAAILALLLWLRPDRQRAGRAVAAGLTLLCMIALVYAVTAEPPLPASAEQAAVQALWKWFEESEWAAAPLVVTHPWFLIELDAAGRRPPGGLPQVQRPQVEQAPPGTVIIWDSHYSIWPPEGMQLRDFKFDPRFTMLRESISADRQFAAYALLKTK